MNKCKAGVNSVLGLLRHVDMGHIIEVLKVHAASIFRAEPKDGDSVRLRKAGDIDHTTRCNNPRTKLTPITNRRESVKSVNIEFLKQ
jgi:hypothetical protein